MLLGPVLVVASVARAEGYSIDTQLVRPDFSGSAPGIGSAEVGDKGELVGGLLVQYERNPLVLVVGDEEQGAVVADRLGMALGGSFSVSDRVEVHLTLPLSASFGTEVPSLAADGVSLADLSAGMRFGLVERQAWGLGARADLYLPLAGAGSYLGEVGPRLAPGMALSLHPGIFRFEGNAALALRGAATTAEQLGLGTEVALGADVSAGLWGDRLRPHAVVVARAGLAPELASAGSVPVELLGGLDLAFSKAVHLDAYGGRGVTGGYGATDARVAVQLRILRRPAREPVEAVADRSFSSGLSDAELDAIIDLPEPEPERVEQPLAEVTATVIRIRDALQFDEATDRLVPASFPTLKAVARLLADHPDIRTLVIEGHASSEGSFPYNYDLSVRRALAVFRALVELGVDPGRLSVRGMGKVAPLPAGTAEDNRRVVFAIAERAPLAPMEVPAASFAVPWSGDRKTAPRAAEGTPPTPKDDEE